MTTILYVNANNPEAVKFLEYARTLPYISEKKAKRAPREEDIQPMTMEEFYERINRAEADIAAGRVISNQEMGRWIVGV